VRTRVAVGLLVTIALLLVGLVDTAFAQTGGRMIRTTPWTCKAPVDLDLLRITVATPDNTLTVDPGCTGRIGKVELRNDGGGDGIKVRPGAGNGAHDLVIGGGYVIAHARSSVNHTDTFQAGAGSRITIRRVAFIGGCAVNCGNANFFTSGWGGDTPTDIVCIRCSMGPWNSTELFSHGMLLGNPSVRTGARYSRVCQGDYFAIRYKSPTSPVNVGNEVVWRSDPSYWSKCSRSGLLAYVAN
jgi:hypothetical protein